jgi:mRNA interferase HigB
LIPDGQSHRTPPELDLPRRRLREFWEKHADAERPLETWYAVVKEKSYKTPHDVKEDFASASFLGGSRTVFDVGGNKYRLVVDMRYDLGRVYIREVLTHEEYDRRSREGTL